MDSGCKVMQGIYFWSFLMFALTPTYGLVYIFCLVLVLVSRDREWLSQLGPTELAFTGGQRQNPDSKTFLNKKWG
jgi:hypothetical protein